MCIDIQKGLLLEHEHRKDLRERLRIRNPATRQTVYLPDLQVGDDSPAWVVARMFFVAKSNNECTVISFSGSEKSVLLGRFRAVTVGVDASWRHLKNSQSNSIHCISNACRWPKIYGYGDEINIWVLMNNSKNEWGKTLTVDYPIPFIKEEKNICMGVDGKRFKPTVLQLKGIQSDKVEEANDLLLWMERDMPKTTSQIISVNRSSASINIYNSFQHRLPLNVMATMSKARRQGVSDSSPWVAEDMVAEILSWLPVESLLRFNCVCKKWYQLIQQHDFVEKHHRRAAICFYYHPKYINRPTVLEHAAAREEEG
nr:putative F-box protein At3g52320 [Ipomoea batatas]